MSKNLDEIYEKFINELKERYQPSKTAQISDIFDYLENARKEGARVSDLCFFLKQLGIDVSETYLPNLMYRIRKERGISKTKSKHVQEEKPKSASPVNENKKTEPITNKAEASPAKKEKEPYDHVKHLPVNEKYSHVYRFRKVNNAIEYYIGTPAEEYYSLGGDPDEEFEKMHPRRQRLAVTKLYNKRHNQRYIYQEHKE